MNFETQMTIVPFEKYSVMQSTKLIVLNGSFSPIIHSGLNTTSAAAPTILQLASLLWGIHLGILFHTLDTLD